MSWRVKEDPKSDVQGGGRRGHNESKVKGWKQGMYYVWAQNALGLQRLALELLWFLWHDHLPPPCASLCTCQEASQLFNKLSPGFRRPAFFPIQHTTLNDDLGNKAYKKLFPRSNNVSPFYGRAITKLWQVSVLAESVKQHTKMFFTTFYTMELKHGTFRHNAWASRASPKVVWTILCE